MGSASIKGVFKALFDNNPANKFILKILRTNVGKDLQKQQRQINNIIKNLKEDIKKIFGVNSIPNYSDRVFKSLKEEIDFDKEITNTQKFK